MTTGPSLRALEVFERLLDLEDDERRSALDEACAGDSELRDEIQRMLAVESSAEFLEFDCGKSGPATEPAGASIGPFTIVRTLGAGGMGVVYEAEQDVPRRQVALKTLPTSFGRPTAELRFRSEIELLARLDHPSIARVLEAGTHTTTEGLDLPYFAMEYVDQARDLVSWGRGRPLRERVALFATVCDAIQHGHQQGVIHRDLKPENVLVDGNDVPKVIDFGVARAIDATDDETPSATRSGEIVGTLRYMAPEQLEGTRAVDTRTDVYALGLLLYELVAEQPPYDLTDLTLTEIAQVIRETPPRPLDRLPQPVPEDLGWIALRALEKEPERRYSSASEFAADLRRFLDFCPVEARRPSRTYALKKLIRRHRVATVSIASVVVAVLLGTVISIAAMLRANDEAAKFRAINDVLTGMFAGVRVEEGGADLPAVELLDRASSEVQGFVDRPDLQAPLHLTLAKSYRSLSLHGAAEREARRAVALAHELGPGDRVDAALQLASSLGALDHWGEARALVDHWVADPAFARADASTRFQLRRTGCSIAMKEGQPAEAADCLRELVEEARVALGPDHPVSVAIEITLIETLGRAQRHAEAEAVARERLAAGGPVAEHALLDVRFLLARAVAQQGRFDEARDMLEELVPSIRSCFGAEHSRTRIAMGELASAYQKTGEPAKAAPILEAVALDWERREGPDHSQTLTARYNHARALADLGDARAVDLLRATYETRERIFGPVDARTTNALLSWARYLRRSGRLDEAEPLLVDLVARAERSLPDSAVERHRYVGELAVLRLNQGRPAEASELFAIAWRGFQRTAGEHDLETLLIGMNYGGSLIESGRLGEAVDVQISVLAGMRETLGEDDPRVCLMLTNLAGTHAQRGEDNLALERFTDALEWADAHLEEDDPRRLSVLDALAHHLTTDMGRPEEALPLFEELAELSHLHPRLDAEDRSRYRLGYARCLSACGEFDAAADLLETVIEMERARGVGGSGEWIAGLESELGVLREKRRR